MFAQYAKPLRNASSYIFLGAADYAGFSGHAARLTNQRHCSFNHITHMSTRSIKQRGCGSQSMTRSLRFPTVCVFLTNLGFKAQTNMPLGSNYANGTFYGEQWYCDCELLARWYTSGTERSGGERCEQTSFTTSGSVVS